MIEIVPPIDIVPIEPLPELSARERIHACAMTALALTEMGDNTMVIDDEDINIARMLFKEGRDPTPTDMKKPGVVLQLEAMLTEYDYCLIDDANRIRNYVANKLIEESNDKNPSIRIRALELLGKLSNVGMFSEKREVIITHQSTETLEEELKKHMSILLDPADVTVTHHRHTEREVSAADMLAVI